MVFTFLYGYLGIFIAMMCLALAGALYAAIESGRYTTLAFVAGASFLIIGISLIASSPQNSMDRRSIASLSVAAVLLTSSALADRFLGEDTRRNRLAGTILTVFLIAVAFYVFL